MKGRVFPRAKREIEIRLWDKWESSVPLEKPHVVHQIGNNFTAKSHRVFEIRCEQQDFAAP